MKILFFIESLRSGGKERRLVELIQYLKQHTDYEMLLVLTEDEIHYKYVHNFGINIRIIKRKRFKKDPRIFFKFYKLCKEFKPDIIHTWGHMLAFYSLPVVIFNKIPHINSQISDAPPPEQKFELYHFSFWLGFKFSNVILANSYAGLQSYGVSGEKCKVIYNGIRLERFESLTDKGSVKTKLNIHTPFLVLMLASFISTKNYTQFIDVAEYFSQIRNDITFLGVGDTELEISEYRRIQERAANLANVKLLGKISHVESLVNACDIGVLFTYSEGISNTIIEYMACGKPVIANDAGGTREIITNNKTGFLLTNETTEEIACIISELIDNKDKRNTIGENAKLLIADHFSIDRMGADFCNLYSETAKIN